MLALPRFCGFRRITGAPDGPSVREVAGQEHLASVSGESRLAKVPGRVDADELGGLEQRVEGGGDLGASTRLGSVVILAPDDRSTDGTLGGIVVERDARVLDKAGEAVPVGDGVGRGLADGERLQRRLLPRNAASRTGAESQRGVSLIFVGCDASAFGGIASAAIAANAVGAFSMSTRVASRAEATRPARIIIVVHQPSSSTADR